MPQPIDNKENPVAFRLRDLREKLGHRKMAFAKLLDIAPSRWSNVENGSPVSRDIADRLKKKIPGLTLDYIYDGDTNGLGDKLRKLIAGPREKSLDGLPIGEHFGRLNHRQDKPVLPTRRKRGGA